MPDWPTDDRLVGTEDMGAFSPSATGSIPEQLAYVTANAAPTFSKLPNHASVAAQFGMQAPAFGWKAWQLVSVGMFGLITTPTLASTQSTWDTTAKAWSVENVTGTLCSVEFDPQAAWEAYGPGGLWPQGFSNVPGILLPGNNTRFVCEYYGKWATASAARHDNRFWGVNQTASAISTTSRGWGFYRKTTSGWTVVSSDGTTVSETSEAGDTSDNALHYFRLEWDGTNVYFYVDNVLKVTKSTNVPAESVTSFPTKAGINAAAADATALWRCVAVLHYWKP